MLTTCFHEFSKYQSTNFSRQILSNICFDFFKCSKLRKNPFWTNEKFVEISFGNSKKSLAWVDSILRKRQNKNKIYIGQDHEKSHHCATVRLRKNVWSANEKRFVSLNIFRHSNSSQINQTLSRNYWIVVKRFCK